MRASGTASARARRDFVRTKVGVRVSFIMLKRLSIPHFRALRAARGDAPALVYDTAQVRAIQHRRGPIAPSLFLDRQDIVRCVRVGGWGGGGGGEGRSEVQNIKRPG